MTVQAAGLSQAHLPVYVFSNYAKARVFVEAYEDYKQTFAAIIEPEPPQAGQQAQPGVAAQEPPLDIKPRRGLWLDWVALVLIVFLLGLPFVLPWPAPPPPRAPPLSRPATAAPRFDVKPIKATGSASAPAARRPKRAGGRATEASREVEKPCGLVRQPTGALTLVPCATEGGVSAGPP
jgi:hypothetical protein